MLVLLENPKDQAVRVVFLGTEERSATLLTNALVDVIGCFRRGGLDPCRPREPHIVVYGKTLGNVTLEVRPVKENS